MVRLFITLLLLAIFFLSGMLFGIDRGQIAGFEKMDKKEDKVEEIVVKEPIVEKTDTTETVNTAATIEIDEPAHFTQKMASFLETTIKGFYEMVVMVVYQIAQAFF